MQAPTYTEQVERGRLLEQMKSERATIQNPILPGFNPDPSIVRVGEDYYVATSTFEWYPGVQIHHSRDLAQWRLLTRPLRRKSQLDLTGVPDSCGVWAPCLSYSGGLFYLVYTDVKRYGRTTQAGATSVSLRDFHNYLVTSPSIEGDFSDPVHLNSSGFDPSLFHDADGRKYLLNMLWDHRPGCKRFAGIVIQEYSARERRLVGDRHLIFEGTALGFTEAPHLYRRGGYYYLITAEGGTGFGHAVTLARSRQLLGPYELSPHGSVLSSRARPDAALARAGHADLVDTPDGETYMVYLCGRPLPGRGRCTLGRETAIQRMRWTDDGWLTTLAGDALPSLTTDAPGSVAAPAEGATLAEQSAFGTSELPLEFQWLRAPEPDELFSLKERPGWLRLFGRESLGSLFHQALVARRQTSHCFSATLRLEFEPEHFQQSAGLVCYYNGSKFHYLFVSRDDAQGKYLRVHSCNPDQAITDVFSDVIRVEAGKPIDLRVEVDRERLQFAFRLDEKAWQFLPQTFDASILSDEAGPPGPPSFTGAFVGVCCQDVSGMRRVADVTDFRYRDREFRGPAWSG